MPVSQPVSARSNTVKREKFYDEFLNIQNTAYPNFENRYSIPDFRQVLLDSQQGMSEIHHQSKKSQSQFEDNIKLQNVFKCHFCGKLSSYQRNLNDPEFPQNYATFHLNAMNALKC
ncbi:hypothetical protein CEXT_345041 [Caerostris extrusa]|uniref:Uncharacterized protein n=1 Tax=Caerostris extrusa TaxID=172846 RepID=A0AAV4PB73_CAEEX|nr:hypothetical protein CEXT_345041 [Caerostris extrusa]